MIVRYFVQILSIFIVATIITFTTYAKTCINIKPATNILSDNNSLDFYISKNNLPTNEIFRVRPISSSVNFVIPGSINNWVEIPNDDKPIKINFSNTDTKNIEMHFLLQNKKSGKVVETQKITIYAHHFLETYLNKLNRNIKNKTWHRVLE